MWVLTLLVPALPAIYRTSQWHRLPAFDIARDAPLWAISIATPFCTQNVLPYIASWLIVAKVAQSQTLSQQNELAYTTLDFLSWSQQYFTLFIQTVHE